MIQNFEDLEIWQKSQELCIAIYKLSTKFPKEEIYGLISQIRRAALSVPTNIAEGYGRRHFLDKVFDILGFATDVEPPVVGEGWAKKPEEICAPPYNGVLFNSGKIFRLEGHTVHLFEKNM